MKYKEYEEYEDAYKYHYSEILVQLNMEWTSETNKFRFCDLINTSLVLND